MVPGPSFPKGGIQMDEWRKKPAGGWEKRPTRSLRLAELGDLFNYLRGELPTDHHWLVFTNDEYMRLHVRRKGRRTADAEGPRMEVLPGHRLAAAKQHRIAVLFEQKGLETRRRESTGAAVRR